MKLYQLGSVCWQESQLTYHALPRLGREGLNLLSPAQPYVSIGYFQDAEQEVDLEFCREHDIPVFRREVGGGAVYLDGNQLFYQLILHKDNPIVPRAKQAFCRRFLEAPIAAYRALGIPAEYKPVNDIVANGRKVSGNGFGELGDYVVLVGNLIVDFDYDMMARVLRVPDEKFRDKVHKTIYENLSTVKREIGEVPPTEELWTVLADSFTSVLGPMEVTTELDVDYRKACYDLATKFINDEWLLHRKRPALDRTVKVRSGVEVKHKVHKAPGGLIRATVHVEDGRIAAVSLSGDFFMHPLGALADLEATLLGVEETAAEAAVDSFYAERSIDSPGVTPADFARVLA